MLSPFGVDARRSFGSASGTRVFSDLADFQRCQGEGGKSCG